MQNFINKLLEDHNIESLSIDSRKISSNTAFFNLSLINESSHIEDAIKAGAKLVFCSYSQVSSSLKDSSLNNIIYVENIKEALIIAASIIYSDEPGYKCAVTGTNGKSSIASYFEQICGLLGENAASIGTLGVSSSIKKIDLVQNLTTEDFITTKKNLDILAKNKVNYVCLEASSHGLEQGRLGDIKFDVSAFVSFSQDHLDYHKSIESYLESKLILFKEHLVKDGIAIVNKQISHYDKIVDYLKSDCNSRIINVGYFDYNDEENYNAQNCEILNIDTKIDSTIIHFRYLGKSYITKVNIVGSFQAVNILISAIMAENCGFAFENIVNILPQLKSPTGRLDRIENTNIFIDYAHTPKSLEFTIQELNKLKQRNSSKLITVFGCGGNRDRIKRPIMGLISAKLSGITIITDDNPRNEDPASIRAEILSSIKDKKNIFEIPGRKDAIEKAMDWMNEYDILLIAGKGHEKIQIIKDQQIEFDEFKIVKNYLKK